MEEEERVLAEREEEAHYAAVLERREPVDGGAYLCGWYDHAADKPFGPGRFPFFTVAGLSWRFGWNDRARSWRD